jgi:hypothetical protein
MVRTGKAIREMSHDFRKVIEGEFYQRSGAIVEGEEPYPLLRLIWSHLSLSFHALPRLPLSAFAPVVAFRQRWHDMGLLGDGMWIRNALQEERGLCLPDISDLDWFWDRGKKGSVVVEQRRGSFFLLVMEVWGGRRESPTHLEAFKAFGL